MMTIFSIPSLCGSFSVLLPVLSSCYVMHCSMCSKYVIHMLMYTSASQDQVPAKSTGSHTDVPLGRSVFAQSCATSQIDSAIRAEMSFDL